MDSRFRGNDVVFERVSMGLPPTPGPTMRRLGGAARVIFILLGKPQAHVHPAQNMGHCLLPTAVLLATFLPWGVIASAGVDCVLFIVRGVFDVNLDLAESSVMAAVGAVVA